MEFSEFIFDLNLIKKTLKRGFYFRAGPTWVRHGTRATWLSHAGPRERLRGAKVTRDIIYIYSY